MNGYQTLVGCILRESEDNFVRSQWGTPLARHYHKIKDHRNGYYLLVQLIQTDGRSEDLYEGQTYNLLHEDKIKIKENSYRFNREDLIPLWKSIFTPSIEALAA